MTTNDAERFFAMPEGRAAYRKWLDDPVTKLVFAAMEARSRPKCAAPSATDIDVAQSHGFVAGVWNTLDTMRALDEVLSAAPPTAEQPQAGYGERGE